MMTVEKRINNEKNIVKFKDLSIGDVYKDPMGRICIKVTETSQGNSFTCGWVEENRWGLAYEGLDEEVTPLKAKLIVWEEKEI